MSKHKERKKLSEITNISSSKILKKYGEPEGCIIYPDEVVQDLDVIDMTLLEEGIFGDYQIEYCDMEESEIRF